MSDREDMAWLINDSHPFAQEEAPRIIADELWAAGWRKKPSREAVTAVVHELLGIYTGEAEVVADAILALLDGAVHQTEETGENR